MTTSILVTGGTGTLGSLVVPLLREAGADVRVLSRHGGDVRADLLSGEGVEAAVAGADTVLHLAGGPKGDDVATRNLLDAARRAEVRHIAYISVIGADRVPLAWLRSKLAAERAIADSGIGWTTLRAAQFHGLTLSMVRGMATLPVVPAPRGLRLQPVDTRDVADRLVDLTLGAPAGLVPDIAGPAVYPMADLIRDYLRAAGKRRPLLPVPMPGRAGRAYRAGANLTLSGATVGKRTWEDFLADHVG